MLKHCRMIDAQIPTAQMLTHTAFSKHNHKAPFHTEILEVWKAPGIQIFLQSVSLF